MNTNKQYKYLNFKLFKQIFKLLTPINLLFLAIFMLITILMPVSDVIYHEEITEKLVMTYYETNGYYILMYVFYVPIITLSAFSFLTKRNASDYYHSFPHTRQCLFITHLAAVLSWLIITISSNTLVTIILYKIFSKYFIISISNLIIFSLSIFLCSLLVIGAILVACSVTGTLFTNIIVTGLILFLPRLIIYMICSLITQNNVMFVTEKIHPLLSSYVNLVFSTPAQYFMYDSGRMDFLSPLANIYTTILAIIYLVSAFFLFKCRKSEVAGKPSSSKKMQSVIRIAIGVPLSIISFSNIFNHMAQNIEMETSDSFAVLIGYIVTFIGMIIYEFVTSRRFKNILRCIPSFIIILVLNAGMLFVMDYEFDKMTSFKPDADEIEYVQLVGDYSYNSYFEQAISTSKIKDKKVIELVSQCLINTAENKTYLHGSGVQQMQFAIKTGSFVKYRWIGMTTAEHADFSKLLLESPQIVELSRNLPEYDSYSSYIYVFNEINEDETKLLYNTLREELKTVDENYFIETMMSQNSGINLSVSTMIGNERFDSFIPLNRYLPKTMLTYINLMNNDSASNEKYNEIMTNVVSGLNGTEIPNELTFDIGVTLYDKEKLETTANMWISSYDIESFPEEAQLTKNILNSIYESDVKQFDSLDIEDGNILAQLNIGYSKHDNANNYVYNNLEFFFEIDEALCNESSFTPFEP